MPLETRGEEDTVLGTGSGRRTQGADSRNRDPAGPPESRAHCGPLPGPLRMRREGLLHADPPRGPRGLRVCFCLRRGVKPEAPL